MIPAGKDWVDLLQGLLAPTIALAAVTITVFQARVNYMRLKHEMFDRRYEMYLAVRRFIREVVAIASDRDRTRSEYDEARKQYLDAIDGAPFVFDWRIDDYFLDILRNAEVLLRTGRGFRIGQPDKSGTVIPVDGLGAWFNKQLGSVGEHSELDMQMESFLRLKQI